MLINNSVHEYHTRYEKEFIILKDAINNAVASLLYSEYIYRIIPLKIPKIPSLDKVKNILRDDSDLMVFITCNLLESLLKDKLSKYINMDVLNDLDKANTIYDHEYNDLRLLIPETIKEKFKIGNNPFMIEDNEIEYFPYGLLKYHYDFLIHQTVLNLYMHDKEMIETNNMSFKYNGQIIKIDNISDIAPLYIDKEIIENDFKEILAFISNSRFSDIIILSRKNKNFIYEMREG